MSETCLSPPSADGRKRQSKRLTDLQFTPPLERVGMLRWKRFDHIFAPGREHALQVLNGLSQESLRPQQSAGAD